MSAFNDGNVRCMLNGRSMIPSGSARHAAYPNRRFLGSLLALALLLLGGTNRATADEDESSSPLGTFISIPGAVDDQTYGRVRNAALALQSKAAKEDVDAYLVLNIQAGPSKFGQVRDLAKFLTSNQLSRVHSIAWVQGRLNGNNVVLAIACNEVVMSDEGEIGDITHYEPLAEDEKLAVLTIARKNRNPLVGETIATAMMDRDVEVIKIRIEGEDGTRLVTGSTLRKEQERDVAIESVGNPIKESGEPGLFNASECIGRQIIASHLINSRDELSALYAIPFTELNEELPVDAEIKARQIQIHGVIEPIMEGFVIRQIQNAVNSGVNLLVFEIDSPGGYVSSSERIALTIGELDSSKIRTVAYVPANAISGAAMIAFGCDEIYMRPTAQIGDAGPIEIRPGQPFEHADSKILSKVRTTMRSLAELKNRPPALLEAMADRNLLVYRVTDPENGRTWYLTEQELEDSEKAWIKGPALPESREENLLNVDGNRAQQLGLAMPVVQDYEDFKSRIGVTGDLQPVEPTWVDTLVYVLNGRVAMFFLLVGGILFLYLEMHFFTGVMGILSALCFSLFFWARFLNGTAGMLEIVLFVLGVGCVLLEIFVIPGFGVFGVSGGLLLIMSIIMASQSFHGFGNQQDLPALSRNLGTLGASIVAVIGLAAVMNRFLPQMPFLKSMVLAPPSSVLVEENAGPRLNPNLIESEAGGDGEFFPGQLGVAESVLRPSGKARINNQYVDVVSDGPYIQQGTSVEVVKVRGNRIVVKASDSAAVTS